MNNLYGVYNRVNPDGFKWFQHDTEWSMDSVFSDGNDFVPGTADDNLAYGWHRDRTGPFPHPNFNEFKWFNPMTIHDRMMVNAEYRLAFVLDTASTSPRCLLMVSRSLFSEIGFGT